jgi:DNA-binding transcriptional regulator LsrR (DeoR family)
MRKIREVLRYRYTAGISLDAIARSLRLSKGVAAKYIRLAQDAHITWPIPDDLDDVALEKRLYRQVARSERAYKYTSFCTHYRAWALTLKPR